MDNNPRTRKAKLAYDALIERNEADKHTIPLSQRCNVKRSKRNGSPPCILESGHRGEHCGHKAGTGQIIWWEGDNI